MVGTIVSDRFFLAGELDLCGNRLNRYQQRNSTGKVDEVKTAGKGRATVIHFHGEASVPSMDGWAEQYFCQGETKVTHCLCVAVSAMQ